MLTMVIQGKQARAPQLQLVLDILGLHPRIYTFTCGEETFTAYDGPALLLVSIPLLFSLPSSITEVGRNERGMDAAAVKPARSCNARVANMWRERSALKMVEIPPDI
jgi:hypothetical protein